MSFLENNINTIIHGDSYELIKLIPDKSIDCIYTDIPYLYQQCGRGNKSALGKRMEKKKKRIEEIQFRRWDRLWYFIRIYQNYETH